MASYESFAGVYDMYMDNVPYDRWMEQIISILGRFGITDGLVADLGCGTGKMTRALAAAGFDMIGIDNSYEMLGVAAEQTTENILYLCQDMRSFELYGTVAAVVSVCDSMNYILDKTDLKQVFSLVNNYLDPEGVFVFDMNTRYKYEQILGENTFAENRPEGSFIWENTYDASTGINAYELTLYIRQEDSEELYERFEEEHFQRAYGLSEIRECLRDAGMVFLNALDADTMGELTDTTERMYIIARESGKNHG
jgi:predicted TPR repeat methyltransferase